MFSNLYTFSRNMLQNAIEIGLVKIGKSVKMERVARYT